MFDSVANIKVRAWDKLKKKMLPIQKISFKTGRMMPYGWNIEVGEERLSPPMLYTGFKDKNGVEIYDGDIVRHNYWKELNEELSLKCFEDKLVSWGSYSDGEYVDDIATWVVGKELPLSELVFQKYDLEVIGNKYEYDEKLK